MLTSRKLLSSKKFKADVILKYTPDEARALKNSKKIPEGVKINASDEQDEGVEFGIHQKFASRLIKVNLIVQIKPTLMNWKVKNT